MYTSHNFCPVSVTVIWLPSLSVQEKGTSSLSTRAPFSPFLQAQFLFFGEHCAKQLTIREDKCFIEEKEKNVWKGTFLQVREVEACLINVSVLFCSSTEHEGRLTCVCGAALFFLVPKTVKVQTKNSAFPWAMKSNVCILITSSHFT